MNRKTLPFFLALIALGVVAWLVLSCGNDMAKKTAEKSAVEDSKSSPPDQPAEGAAPKTPPAPIDPATAASVRGVVKFDGPDTERKPVFMAGNADCKAMHPEPALEENLIVKGGKIKNAMVFVRKGLEGREFPAPDGRPVLDQVGCLYTPHVLAMRTGQTLEIRNSDALLHNVHCESNRNREFTFNTPMPRKGDKIEVKAEKAEILTLRCDVHSWMRSYIGLFSHPFYQITGDDGAFELKGLPPGKYTIRVWHEMLDPIDQEIELGAKEEKTLDFLLKKK